VQAVLILVAGRRESLIIGIMKHLKRNNMTAVEFLSEQIRLTNIEGLRFQLWDAIEQAKEMEKQQGYNEEDLKEAFLNGWELRNGDLPFPKAKNKWFKQLKKK